MKIVNDRFLSCTCGFCARMKIPCQHIMNIAHGYEPSMFGLRWLIIYQHSFDREGYDDLSKHLREMELEEFSRRNVEGEICLADNTLLLEHKGRVAKNNYPIKLGDTSDFDCDNLELLHNSQIIKKVIVRGYDIETQLNSDQHKEDNHDGDINMSLSQDTILTLEKDCTFLEQLQNDQIMQTKVNASSIPTKMELTVVKVRECVKALEHEKQILTEYLSKLDALNKQFISKISNTKRKSIDEGNAIAFEFTGYSNRRYEKRKRIY